LPCVINPDRKQQQAEEEIGREEKKLGERLKALDLQVGLALPEGWQKRDYYSRRQSLTTRMEELKRAVVVFNVRIIGGKYGKVGGGEAGERGRKGDVLATV